ncbi:hypothetical protein [Fictibacillus sp. NRS-1165]|uniref:hypothetical protein n=1 Tax=Fictibacillus sp. NRS-1165 TaxID=3144463 RepID=UPI003D1E399E
MGNRRLVAAKRNSMVQNRAAQAALSDPELRAILAQLPPEEQAEILARLRARRGCRTSRGCTGSGCCLTGMPMPRKEKAA